MLSKSVAIFLYSLIMLSLRQIGRLFFVVCYLVLFTLNADAQEVFISEIVASNDNSFEDEDGDSPDWIELYNASESPVSLTGWYLTDDSDDLTQWSFPATTLPAKGFLVVFASDKDRAVAGQELHTNFKLKFGAQFEDISYGYPFVGSTGSTILLDAGASAKAHIPTSASDAVGWQAIAFSDSSWLSGVTGVGYEASSGYQGLIGLDVSAMQNVNSSIYMRVPFTLVNSDEVTELTLKMKYDDGFIAYINGTEVTATSNTPANPSWNSGASSPHDDNHAVVYQTFDLTGAIEELEEEDNLLAIHGVNFFSSSSDLIFVPRLEARFAREIDETESGLLESPTPGEANTVLGYIGFIDDPMNASPARGFYDSAISVTLTNPTPGTSIRYTTDGSEPTAFSNLYSGPIAINSTTTLRSRAFRTDWQPSASRTDTYIFVADVAMRSKTNSTINGQVLEYGMDAGVRAKTYFDSDNQLVTIESALKSIPSISITTDDDNLYDPSIGIYVNASQRLEVPASAELIYPNGDEGFQINAGLRIRGGASRTSSNPKHSFRLFFRGEYGPTKLKFPLFEDEGVDEYDKVDLRSAQNYSWSKDNDSANTFLRDIFARDTAAAMEQTYPRSRYYHLYLNGEYWGLFMTEERPVASFGESYLGGDKDDYDTIKVIGTFQPGSYTVEATDGTMDAYERLFNATMAGFSDSEDYFSIQGLDANGQPDASKERLVDVENLIDYLLIIYYTAASDNSKTWFIGRFSALNNMYALYNRVNPDGFKWIQHDTEHSLDQNRQLDMTGPFPHSNFSQLKYFNPMTLHEELSVNPEYQLKFADRVYKHLQNGGVLVKANAQARLDYRAAQIDQAIVANAARWGSTSRDRDTWENAVSVTRNWMARSGDRCNEVIGYLAADGLVSSISPPSVSRVGGLVENDATVTLSSGTGTIYYTTDGTDPRQVGGAVAGSAYSGAITIPGPIQLKARVRSSSGDWSALAEATYWTADIPLAVTELMYNAPEGNSHDLIEVRNISDEPVSLEGYKLDDGIEFKFEDSQFTSLASGESMVVVDDIDAFNQKYLNSNEVLVAGEFKGDLDNGGEKIELEFKGEDLISFVYDDSRNWPQAADGAGHSLVPLSSAIHHQERGSLDYGGNWRASTYIGGSPGEVDPLIGATVLINEVIAHTDTGNPAPFDSNDVIELYNPTSTAINLSGFYLSDNLDNLEKWAIPSNTTIPAYGFLAFDEDDFHTDRVNGFGLNKAGEEVVLSSANGVVDSVRFKGQENGASYGRFPDGSEYWMLTEPTIEAENSIPSLQMQISEIMYHPLVPGGDYEYVILENVGSNSVTLENATGTYRIDGDIEFDFPSGTTLSSGETLWLVSFDPSIDLVLLSSFASTYGITAASENIMGPYSGSLSNRAGRVAIERPQDSDDPLKPLDISWVVVDEAFYADQFPWPTTADGTGFPLVRTGLSSWNALTSDDTDADGIADTWEMDHFGSLNQANSNSDEDRFSNYEEYIAGTDPKNSASQFKAVQVDASNLSWPVEAGRVYSVYWTDDLEQPFQLIATGITTGSYTDTANTGAFSNFYYVVVELD